MGLNVYKKITLNSWRHAYVYNPITKERKLFKYRQMTDREIEELQYARGLDSASTTLTIATNDTINFDVKTRIILNGFFYTVEAITEKLLNVSNGLYRNETEKMTYLIIKSGAVYDKSLYNKTN